MPPPMAAQRRPFTPVRLGRAVYMRPILAPFAAGSQSLSLAARRSRATLPGTFKDLESPGMASAPAKILMQPALAELPSQDQQAAGVTPLGVNRWRPMPPLWTEAGGQSLAIPVVQPITPPPVLRDCEIASEPQLPLGMMPIRPLPSLGYWDYQATKKKAPRPQFVKNLMSTLGVNKEVRLSLASRALGMVAASFEPPAPRLALTQIPRQPEFIMAEMPGLTVDVHARETSHEYRVEAGAFELMDDLISSGAEFAQNVFSTLSPTAIWASPEQKPSLQLSVREAEAAPQPSIGLRKPPSAKGELRWVARKVPWMPVG